jgi:hypothetical protein
VFAALAWAGVAVGAAACGEQQRVPTSVSSAGAGQGPVVDGNGGASASGSGGGGGGGATASGSGGGGGGGAGAGGSEETSPNCACLLDQVADGACGACLGFAAFDECAERYTACQADATCTVVDQCILNAACATAQCLLDCRANGTPEGLALLDALYACTCTSCAACSDGACQ